MKFENDQQNILVEGRGVIVVTGVRVTKASGTRVWMAGCVVVGTLMRYTGPKKVLQICFVYVVEMTRPRSSSEVFASITRPRMLKIEAIFILESWKTTTT